MIDSSRTTMMKIKRRTSLSTTRTRRILLTAALCALLSPATLPLVTSFTPLSFSNTFRTSTKTSPNKHPTNSALSTSTSSTQLNVWWFGGTETSSITNNDSTTSGDSCELVAVRIERTSANSRRIAGDIIVPRPIDDVWSILTDYDNLSIHVPNLVESRRVNPKPSTAHHSPGNGSYTCRLFQKGAQKIVGFEFGASVTMDMKERITLLNDNGTMNNGIGSTNEVDTTEEEMMIIPQRRSIGFKCVDSQFFSVFDGEWKVTPTIDPEDPTKSATKIEYVVDVRPKGPVPVAALEWRIREDVPSNLRAVKQASIELGRSSGNDDDDDGVVVVEELTQQRQNNNGGAGATTSTSSTGTNQGGISSRQQLEGRVRSTNDMRRQTTTTTTTTTTSPNMEREAMRSTTVMTASSSSSSSSSSSTNPTTATKRSKQISKLSPVRVEWYEDETMAAYLRKRRS